MLALPRFTYTPPGESRLFMRFGQGRTGYSYDVEQDVWERLSDSQIDDVVWNPAAVKKLIDDERDDWMKRAWVSQELGRSGEAILQLTTHEGDLYRFDLKSHDPEWTERGRRVWLAPEEFEGEDVFLCGSGSRVTAMTRLIARGVIIINARKNPGFWFIPREEIERMMEENEPVKD